MTGSPVPSIENQQKKLVVTTIPEGNGISHGNMPYYASTMEDASCNLGMEIDKLTRREAPQA